MLDIHLQRDAPRHSAAVASVGTRADAEVAAQEMECAICKFNVSWTCEHSGCGFCSGKQRKIGGLKVYIRRTDFKCPLPKIQA